MPERIHLPAGSWWRFSSYCLDDGRIRPGPDAELQRYDPWEEHHGDKQGSLSQPPYQRLIAHVRKLRFIPRPGPGPLRQLEPKSEEALLTWCSQHGLLGILSHESLMAWLAPRWEPLKGNKSLLIPVQRQYVRTNEGWTTYTQPRFSERHSHLRNQPQRCDELLSADEGPEDWGAPGVLSQGLDREICQRQGFASSWRRFFPGTGKKHAETHRYPAPLSEEFWRGYAEPVEDFVHAVTRLNRALFPLRSDKKVQTEGGPGAPLQEGIDLLHSMTRTVRPVLTPTEDGSFRQEWLSTSLLGSLAMMAFLDLSHKQKLLICDNCGNIFSSKAYQAHYCSTTCQKTAEKRRYRARNKTKQD